METTLDLLKQEIAAIQAKIDALEANSPIDTSPIITGARPVGVLAGPDGDFDHALKWAEDHGTRLFTRAEAQYLFEHSETFRAAVKGSWFWVLESASVSPYTRSNAWLFYGLSGDVKYGVSRDYTYGVRAVGGE
jgi:hypothetical protein